MLSSYFVAGLPLPTFTSIFPFISIFLNWYLVAIVDQLSLFDGVQQTIVSISVCIWTSNHSSILLDVQCTVGNLLHTLSLNASIFFISAFLIIYILLPYVATGNASALFTLIFISCLVFSVMFLSFPVVVKLGPGHTYPFLHENGYV